MPLARLTRDFRHRAGPDPLSARRSQCRTARNHAVEWHGSGDVPALTRANAYLVTDPDRAEYLRGELIRVLCQMKKSYLITIPPAVARMVDVSDKKPHQPYRPCPCLRAHRGQRC